MKEAERLYLVHCAICHGQALDGNGPLWKGGDGPYPAAPRNLLDDYSKNLSDGQMYHVIMYGKGQMGILCISIESSRALVGDQLHPSKQGGGKTAATATADSAAAGTTAPPANAAPATGMTGTTSTTTTN